MPEFSQLDLIKLLVLCCCFCIFYDGQLLKNISVSGGTLAKDMLPAAIASNVKSLAMHGGNVKPAKSNKNFANESSDLQIEDLNQCAGTMQHYSFPPTGYVPIKTDTKTKLGKQLYDRFNCASCHVINDLGGTLGPPLDGIGGHRGEQFLVARLLDPEAQMREFPEVFGGRPNIMPHPHLSQKKAKLLAHYLLSLPEPEAGFLLTINPLVKVPNSIATTDLPTKESVLAGQKIFLEHSCAACHVAGSSGGWFAPCLNGIGKRYSIESIQKIISSQEIDPGMRSQASILSENEIKQLAEFLHSLSIEGKMVYQ